VQPIISRLIVKRFRSFPNEVATFGNPTFLVGRNGAGKSNFADLFSFVGEAMSSPLQAVFDRRGGISAVRNRSSGRSYPPNMGIGIHMGAINGQVHSAHFAFEIKALPNYGFDIVREQCAVTQVDGTRYWYDRRGVEFRTNVQGLSPLLEPTALSLPVIGGDQRFAPVHRTLAAMRVYSIEPARLREMQDPDSGAALRSDGSNAASVLQELNRTSEQSVELIRQYLQGIVPNTTAVNPKKHGNKLSLEFVQEWANAKPLRFEAYNMSEGTLRVLGLLLAVFQAPAPSVLVLEEPEATVHPGALGAILDLIHHASRQMQVIVTTHSSDLLDGAKWLTDEHLRLVVWHEGASHLAPVADSVKSALRQHLMGAGELLRSNAMTPAPLFDDRPDQLPLFENLG